MSQAAVIQLVKSLSKVEKRRFKLSTKKQAGNKDYLILFNIIDQSTTIEAAQIKEKFKALRPKTSLDNTARYLLKLITDCLIQSKVNEDNSFQLLYGLLRVNVLKERSIQEESYKELKKLQKIAIASQNHYIKYMISRMELNYLCDLNFPGLSEKRLVEMQMDIRDTAKDMRNTHEHYSLYELLKYRLIYSGKVLSEDGKKQLNDLLLSEMGLITGRVKNHFESQKLHLLFQSFFFTDIGDYKSALKTFYELNLLFEQNVALWGHPPLDYLSSLDGILDSLRTIGRYDEMPFYINKMKLMDDRFYPEYFRFIVRKEIIIYQLAIFNGEQKFQAAEEFIKKIDPLLLRTHNLGDFEKQNELLLFIGLTYFGINDLKKSQKYINEIVLIRKPDHQSIIYKAARLLGILIHYDDNNPDYLDYEIRSYKRVFQKRGKLLKTEKVIFKVIKLRAKNKNNEIQLKKMEPIIADIVKDKYERQLLKYFDFIGWITAKIKTTK